MKLKTITSGILVLVVGGVLLSNLLGTDFNPFMRTARQSLSEKVLAMVDRQELQLNRAKQTLVDSRQAIAEQAKQKARLEQIVAKFKDSVSESRQTALHEHQNLAAMQRQLIAGETMFTSVGNPISNRQLATQVEQSSRRLKSAKQREESMQGLLGTAEARLTKLT